MRVLDTRILVPSAGINVLTSSRHEPARHPQVMRARHFIRQYACQGIKTDQVANYVGVSRSSLESYFRQELGYVRATSSIVSQKPTASVFVVNTHVQLNDGGDGDRAGLIINAMQYAWLGLRKNGGATQLVYTTCTLARIRGTESSTVVLPHAPDALYLRMTVAEGAKASFSYSTDNVNFISAGQPLAIGKGRCAGHRSAGSRSGSAGERERVQHGRRLLSRQRTVRELQRLRLDTGYENRQTVFRFFAIGHAS